MAKAPYRISSHAAPEGTPASEFEFALKKTDVIHKVETIIQLFPDVEYPWDPVLVAQVKEVEPRAIPVWIKEIYRTPAGSEVVFGFNGIYRYDYQEPILDWRLRGSILRVGDYTGPIPNYEWVILKGDEPGNGWPGPYIGLGDASPFIHPETGEEVWLTTLDRIKRVVHTYQYEPESPEEANRRLDNAQAEHKRRVMDKLEAEHDYRWDNDGAVDRKAASGVTWSDIQAHVHRVPERPVHFDLGQTGAGGV